MRAEARNPKYAGCSSCPPVDGARAIPARSGSDGVRMLPPSEHAEVFVRAASRDGSRSGELDTALSDTRGAATPGAGEPTQLRLHCGDIQPSTFGLRV